MWENAYLSIKNPKASQPQISHFAHTTPLRYIGNFWPQNLGPPLTKSWIRTCSVLFKLETKSQYKFTSTENFVET